jgi:ADP-ribosylglycohydrolase
MQSYAACKKFDAADYADHIASIFRENRIVGRGRATELAAQNLMSGIPWDKAGTPPPSAGNGSAMRAGPIGLLFFDEPENLIQAAREQGLITHQDIRCSAGAVAIAGAVALSLLMDGIESNAFIKQLQDWTAVIDRSFADSVVRLTDWIKLPPETATQFIGKEGLSQSSLDNWHGISPFVTGSVLWSLYSFLRSTDDYWETICTAIAVGGDVDTTAAMAGAISGARLGLDAIPSHLAARLSDQGTWGYEELINLANQCYEIKIKQIKNR